MMLGAVSAGYGYSPSGTAKPGKSASDTDAAAKPGDTSGSGNTTDASGKSSAESAEMQSVIAKLQATDRAVRAHEFAHMAAGAGVVTGGPSFTFQTGPDGKSYAVGGEVPIDMSPGKTPEETIDKARTIRAAALAPAEPSGADLAIAARASQMEAEARIELNEKARNPDDPGAGAAALSMKIDRSLNSQQGNLLAVA